MPTTTTATPGDSPSEPGPGARPSRDIPAKFQRAPRSIRSGSRLIWVVIMILLLLMILALIGLARARSTGRMNAGLGFVETVQVVRASTFTNSWLSVSSLSPSWAT
jgi:hypothetical protein